eukprot:1897503-Prymnesium_polylepis.2
MMVILCDDSGGKRESSTSLMAIAYCMGVPALGSSMAPGVKTIVEPSRACTPSRYSTHGGSPLPNDGAEGGSGSEAARHFKWAASISEAAPTLPFRAFRKRSSSGGGESGNWLASCSAIDNPGVLRRQTAPRPTRRPVSYTHLRAHETLMNL